MSVTTETGVWYRKDEYDKLMDDFLRYRQALYRANGFLIQMGKEPVKLEYPKLVCDPISEPYKGPLDSNPLIPSWCSDANPEAKP